MKALFLTIALSLFSILCADDFTFSDFKSLEGTSYVQVITVGREFPEEEIPKNISPLTIAYLNNGKMEAKFTMKKEDKCEEISLILEKTDEPKKILMYRSQQFTCATIKLSEKKYWTLLCQKECQDDQIGMALLVGPNTDENPKALRDFYDFIHREKFDDKIIFTPRQTEAVLY
ncbi:late lactation protein A-like [Macrotis lagotis]|uniref:late lactation protein A-like n=1 Tax=Macrotis lagotis TaxID=92651 RepID=UPI003D689EE9